LSITRGQEKPDLEIMVKRKIPLCGELYPSLLVRRQSLQSEKYRAMKHGQFDQHGEGVPDTLDMYV
jgi:hypothetical protein